jgi:hypothetical protein
LSVAERARRGLLPIGLISSAGATESPGIARQADAERYATIAADSRLEGMDATFDIGGPAARPRHRRYHLLVGPNGWLADAWFPDLKSAVDHAHALEALRQEPAAGWRVKDLHATIVASSDREEADANAKVALLFLLPVPAVLGALAVYLALARPAGG